MNLKRLFIYCFCSEARIKESSIIPEFSADALDQAIRFFLYVLVFWLPYSPAVVETCVIISVVLWFIKRAVLCKKKFFSGRNGLSQGQYLLNSFRPPRSLLDWPIVLFLTVCFFSAAGSIFYDRALEDLITKILEWFAVYWLVLEVIKDKKHLKIVFAIFFFTAVSTAVDAVVQFHITLKDIFNGHSIVEDRRATAGLNAPSSLGAYLALVIPIMLSWTFLTKRPFFGKMTMVLVCGVFVWALALTFSRGAWLATVLGSGLLLGMYIYYRSGWDSRLAYGMIGVLIVGAALMAWGLNRPVVLKFLHRADTAQWRIRVWEDTIQMIQDRPLLGHGVNTYMPIFQSYRRDPGNHPTYAHNCYFQLTAEVGLLGILIFVSMLFYVFKESLEKARILVEKEDRLMIYCLTSEVPIEEGSVIPKRSELSDSDFANLPRLGILSLGLISGIFAFWAHSFFDTNLYSLQLSVYIWFMTAVQIRINQLGASRSGE